MTFLAPWSLAVGAAAAMALVALHLIARARPRRAVLPTARFVPDRSAHARAFARRPTDVALLALRVLTVLLLGAAFARPVLAPRRRAAARVVVVDRSRAAGDISTARDSARELLRPGDLLVVFDSTARRVAGQPRDTLGALMRSTARGSLSAALVAGLRAAAALRAGVDEVELVLVSPAAAEEWDAATARLGALWIADGRARLVRVSAATEPSARVNAVRVDGAPDDALRAAVALLGARAAGDVRIVRGPASSADTAWAAGAGRVLVRWPAADSLMPNDGDRADTAGAVLSEHAVVVAPFPRHWRPAPGRAIAWWADGQAAATERVAGDGCVRDVAIPLPRRGDLALGAGFRRLVSDLIAPCGGAMAFGPGPDSLGWTRRPPPAGAAGPPVRLTEAAGTGPGPLATWLLAAAALLLVGEPLLRRRPTAPDQ